MTQLETKLVEALRHAERALAERGIELKEITRALAQAKAAEDDNDMIQIIYS